MVGFLLECNRGGASLAAAADTLRSFSGVEARRSTRIEHPVPLIVSGQNSLGEPFQERTSALSFNLHGCRYPSRHDFRVGTWVALQVAEIGSGPISPLVRALVRSIHAPRSPRELSQVGVELEIPANVWGISSPPEDWVRAIGGAVSMSAAATAVAPAREPIPIDAIPAPAETPPEEESAQSVPVPPPPPETRRQDAEKAAAPAKPARVVITPDQLVQALQEKLLQAAEKAVETALASQLDEAVRRTLSTIDDIRRTSMEQVEQFSAWQREALAHLPGEQNLKVFDARLAEAQSRSEEQLALFRSRAEEMAQRLEKIASEARRDLAETRKLVERITREFEPQIRARLDESVARAADEFDAAAARVSDRQLVRLMEDAQMTTRELSSQLEARGTEARSHLLSGANDTLDEFRRQLNVHAELAVSEATQRTTSSLASLDAENRTACEARRRSLEQDVARAAEQSTDQFRTAIKAFLYSCLVAAVSAVDEHAKSTLDGLVTAPGKTPENIDLPAASSEQGGGESNG